MTLLSKDKAAKPLIELEDIIGNFYQWNDLLSLKIKDWGGLTLKIKNGDIGNLESAVDALFKHVLLTSFLTPVTDPILYEKHTWNRGEFDAYLDNFHYSPFDRLALNREQSTVHTFAIEIINWAKPFKTSSQEIIPFHLPSLIQYLSMGALAEVELKNYTLEQTLKDMTAETKVARQGIEEITKREKERMQDARELHNQTIHAGIDSIKQSQNLTGQILEARLRSAQHNLYRTHQTIADSEERNKAKLDQIRDLERRIQSL